MKKDKDDQETLQFLKSSLEDLIILTLKDSNAEAKSLAMTIQAKLDSKFLKNKTSSQYSKRRQSVCMKLPELSGTSLLRKSVEVCLN